MNKTKKSISLKFIGFTPGFDEREHELWKILSERYDLTLGDNPDFIICSIYGVPYEYTQYDCPRILYLHENLSPDFNLFDYVISHDRLVFEDRHFRYPLCLDNYMRWHRPGKYASTVAHLSPPPKSDILKKKDIFCNFIFSKESENCIREKFFEKLSSEYKQVSSAGSFLNNMPDGKIIHLSEKIEFQRRCKFTIAFEPIRQSGFCTEKILDAFYAQTIPIYYGDPYVTEIFNPESFINVSDYDNFDDVIKEIIRLDTDDEAYIKMLSTPAFNDPQLPERLDKEFCEFIYHIFDQKPEDAFRRSRVFAPKIHNNELKRLSLVLGRKAGARIYNLMYIYITSGIRGIFSKLRNKAIR